MDEDFINKAAEIEQEYSLESSCEESLKKDKREQLLAKISPEIVSLANQLHISLFEIIDKIIPLLEI